DGRTLELAPPEIQAEIRAYLDAAKREQGINDTDAAGVATVAAVDDAAPSPMPKARQRTPSLLRSCFVALKRALQRSPVSVRKGGEEKILFAPLRPRPRSSQHDA